MPRLLTTWSVSVTLAGVMLAASGCTESSRVAEPNPAMQIDPTSVGAGDQVDVLFPEKPLRGLRYVLEDGTDDGWVPEFAMRSGAGSQEPIWWPVEEDDTHPVGAIGITGPGPDRLVIPDDAKPGNYRICTDVDEAPLCAPLTIE